MVSVNDCDPKYSYNEMKFHGAVDGGIPFQKSELVFCSSIRNSSTYANEANIVNIVTFPLYVSFAREQR